MTKSYSNDRRGRCARRRSAATVSRFALAVALAAASLSCGGDVVVADGSYRCPMHPTYDADRPGDCPICGMRLVPAADASPAPSAVAAGGRYACPMHPEVESDKPDRCPECRMKLEPVNSGDERPESRGFGLSSSAVRMAGIQTEPAVRGRVTRTVRAAGTVLADPDRVRHVVARAPGWIEKLEVKASGARVRRGEPLFTLYAPDLVPVQEEYIRYARTREATRETTTLDGRRRLLEGPLARQRIDRYELPEAFLAELERDGVARESIPFTAPVSGIVQLRRELFEGQQVEPGMDLMAITDLSEVWVQADLFEMDIARVREGQEVDVRLPYDARVAVKGRVIRVNPFLDPGSRTLRILIRCRNEGSALWPGMFATVEISVQSDEGVTVPETAVLDTGQRQVAFVETRDGWFEPRDVRLGLRGGDRVLVLGGIEPGEKVVVRGNFLLDSESRLRGGAARSAAEATESP